MTVYIALGSNVGDRAAHLQAALTKLAALPAPGVKVSGVSRFARTAPVGATGHGWYLNAVARAETDLLPQVLLGRLRRIEHALGRRRPAPGRKKTPRRVDLDLILYGRARIQTPQLTVPHPRFAARRFVLDGLAELAPTLHAPGSPLTMAQLQARALRR